LRNKNSDFKMQNLMRLQLDRAIKLMNSGAPLGKVLKGRIGFELRMVILGGSRIAKHLFENPDNLFARPRLTQSDLVWICWKALMVR